MDFVEILGYVAMVLVAYSFLMKDIIKLRVVNTLGCICFVAYGLLLPSPSYSVAGVNLLITGINIYYLLKSFQAKSAK